MAAKNDVLIIVPAYNEAQSIAYVLTELQKKVSGADIVVIDDGSMDNTSSIARTLGGVQVIVLPHNLGIGGAVQTGYKFAKEGDYSIAVQVDGDGQHPADQVEKLVAAIRRNEADVVIGSRYLVGNDEEKDFFRRLAKNLLSIAISFLIKQKITDSSSGLRAVNKKAIYSLAHSYPRDYPEPESIVLLAREGFRIKEIPVRMQERFAGKSSINQLKGIYYLVKVMLCIFVDMFKDPLQLIDAG